MSEPKQLPTQGDVDNLQFRQEWGSGRLNVYLDGVDVNDRCQAFDIQAGTVRLAKLKNGQPYLEPGTNEQAVEICSGQVTVEERARG